jgi:outer membrane lipoprotein-sorting protein
MRIQRTLIAGLLAFIPALTGCLTHTHTVLKTRPPDVVQNATLSQLLTQVDERYDSIKSATFIIQISTTTGGSLQGTVKESMNFSGFIVLGKPENINFILKVPIVGSDALDMVSDGTSFKMKIPHYSCAIEGSDVSQPAQKGLYSLRPAVILDSMLIHGLQPDQIVSMTQDSRTLPDPKTRKDVIEEPDYDVEFLSQPDGKVAHTLRVVHIGRTSLLPYRQDIYNADGKVATQAFYSNYKTFGDIVFPTKIVIQRPLDELGLTITVTKATFNQPLDPGQFKIDIPSNYAVQHVDDPASAATNPCVSHASQSQH